VLVLSPSRRSKIFQNTVRIKGFVLSPSRRSKIFQNTVRIKGRCRLVLIVQQTVYCTFTTQDAMQKMRPHAHPYGALPGHVKGRHTLGHARKVPGPHCQHPHTATQEKIRLRHWRAEPTLLMMSQSKKRDQHARAAPEAWHCHLRTKHSTMLKLCK